MRSRLYGWRITSRRTLLQFGFLFLIFVASIWYEEAYHGWLINYYGNFYWNIIYRPIHVRRTDLPSGHRLNISVVVVVDDQQRSHGQYALAQHTLRCYCALHGYPLAAIDLAQWRHSSECPQKDFMFRRHCALATWIAANPGVEWALFLDADMGVINPDHLLEQYLLEMINDRGNVIFDLIFYERSFNGEIMAGSYWVRNSEFGREMLHFWANYSEKVPTENEFRGGTDNGAIHAVFLDLFCAGPHCSSDLVTVCLHYWNIAQNFDDLRPFEVCARNALGGADIQEFRHDPNKSNPKNKLNTDGRVLLLTDFRHYWARDGWLTGNQWSPRDFIFHGWQLSRMDQPVFARWHSPLVLSVVDLVDHQISQTCSSSAQIASFQWPYKDSFLRSQSEIDTLMEGIIKKRRQQDIAISGQIQN